MKRIVAACVLALGCAAPAWAVKAGQTWDEVEAELGKPLNKLEAPGRSIGRWADVEVIFVDGRATSVVRRDLAAEAAAEARRKEEAERLRRAREEIEKEKRLREEAGEGDRLERERQAQSAKIAALEKQLEAERRKLQALDAQAESQGRVDAAAQADLLRKEIALLRQEIQRTLSVGEVHRASRMQQELLGKENQLKALERSAR